MTVSDEYYFDERDDKGEDSVYDQLKDAVSKRDSKRYVDSIKFSTATSDYGDLSVTRNRDIDAEDIEDIYFTPKKNGTAKFEFSVYTKSPNGSNETSYGVLTIKVTDTTSNKGDVVFTADVGDTVYMDVDAFEDFWDDIYSGGKLEYVTFNSVSGGTLKNENDKSAGSTKYYVSPGRSDLDLDEVHFEPSNSTVNKKATTVSFGFTAHGTKKTGSTTYDETGTVNIIYMSGSPSDIKYSVGTNGSVSLKASDFTAAYKEATGSSAPSNMTIVLQNVPRSGQLTYNDSSKRNSSDVKLTASNIKGRNFTTKSSGTNQINDVTYTGSSANNDSVEYIAYSGSTPKFKGTVTFGGSSVPTDVVVTFQSVGGAVAQFSWSEFTKANSALSGATTIRFTAPTSGSLYLNGVTSAAAPETGLC